MISSFRKIVSGNKETQRIQENTALVLREISSKEIIDGILITATVGSTATMINHRLGRQPLGWFLTDRQASTGNEGNIVRTAWDDKTISLKSTGTGTVNLTIWVF